MKINEFLTEQQLDELNWQDVKKYAKRAGNKLANVPGAIQRGAKSVGQGATNVLGGAGNAIDTVASAPQGFGRAIKRGYGAGVNAIGGPSDEELAGQASPTQATQQTSQPASATGGVATPGGTTAAGFMSGLGQEPAAQAIRDYGKTTGGVTSAPGANTEVPATPAQGQPAQQSRDTTARRNARSNIVKKVGAPATPRQTQNAGKINVGNPVMETDFSAILLRKMQ